jgi:hypothetical protein
MCATPVLASALYVRRRRGELVVTVEHRAAAADYTK